MCRIALVVVVSTLIATPVARANDFAASADATQDRIAADAPKGVTATSPVKGDNVTATSPVKGDDVTATSPVKDAETSETAVAPFVRVQPPSGSLAGITALRSLHVGLAVTQAYDVYSTTRAINRGAIELNPLLKNTVKSRAAFIGLKVAVTAGPIWQAEKLWRNQRRVAAIALMAASNGIMLAVAAHNTSVMRNPVTVR